MITNSFANSLLNYICGRGSLTAGLSVYIGLSTTEPTRDGGNFTEPSTSNTGYERYLLGNYNQSSSYAMDTAATGAISNNKIIYFNESEVSWGTITHFGIFNAKTGGQLIAYGALSAPITVNANNVALIRKEELQLTLE